MPAPRPPLFRAGRRARPGTRCDRRRAAVSRAGPRPTDIAALLSASPEPTPTRRHVDRRRDTTAGRGTHRSTGQPTDGPGPTPSTAPDANGGTPPKDAGAGSVAPEDLTGYIWPVRDALDHQPLRAARLGASCSSMAQEYHDGLDLATRCGDRVRAAHDGTVLYAGRNFDPYIGYWGDAARHLRSPGAAGPHQRPADRRGHR